MITPPIFILMCNFQPVTSVSFFLYVTFVTMCREELAASGYAKHSLPPLPTLHSLCFKRYAQKSQKCYKSVFSIPEVHFICKTSPNICPILLQSS